MISNYRIHLFGELSIQHGSETITRFRTRKAAHLLGYLALNLHTVSTREMLIDLFWSEMDMDAGRDNLSATLAALRRQAEPAGTPAGAFLQADRQTVRLNPETVTTDVREWEQNVRAAHREGISDDAKLEALRRATELYRGDLLPDCYEDWAVREQQRRQEQYGSALETMATLYARAGQWDDALTTAGKALKVAPYSEEARRAQMRAYAAGGKWDQATAVYRELETTLRTEFQARPDAVTRRLFEQMQREPEAFRDTKRTPASPVVTVPIPSVTPTAPSAPATAPAHHSSFITHHSAPSLPLQLTRFFGREQHIAHLALLLTDGTARLVTLLGPGGVGKTRLSIELGKRLAESFGGRVFFAELAGCAEPGQIPAKIIQALRLPAAASGDPMERIAQALGQERTLLILDNFEHLLHDAPVSQGEHASDLVADLISRLLSASSGTVCLATSRIPLHIGGEREYPLPPLETPEGSLSPAELLLCESVSLYEERAKAVRPDFAVTVHNADDVAKLCRKLEGMPLAIEMAASWIRTLPPSRILERQERQIDLLVSRRRDLPARHQSLRAAIEWSYDLLTPEQQRFFASLAVFRGSWTLDAAEAILGADTTLEFLLELQEHSLVFEQDGGEAKRYRLLEPLREFAVEKLQAMEQAGIRQAHAEYFACWAEDLANSRDWNREKERLDQLAAEHDNLLGALDWQRSTNPAQCLSLSLALSRFWEVRGFLPLGQKWLESALALEANSGATALRSQALSRLGTLLFLQGNYPQASLVLNEALQIAESLEAKDQQAAALHGLGNVAFYDQQYSEAKRLYEQALCWRIQGNDRRSLAAVYQSLGNVLVRLEQHDEAHAYLQQALQLRRDIGDKSAVAMSLGTLGHEAFLREDLVAAIRYEKEALALFYEQQMSAMVTLCLAHFAQIAYALQDMESAARLFGAANRLRVEYHFPAPPREQDALQNQLRDIRLKLTEETFQQAYAEGAALSMDRAVRYVLNHDDVLR